MAGSPARPGVPWHHQSWVCMSAAAASVVAEAAAVRQRQQVAAAVPSHCRTMDREQVAARRRATAAARQGQPQVWSAGLDRQRRLPARYSRW